MREIGIIPPVLEMLGAFAKERNNTEGMIFRNRRGGAVNRTTIWRKMKKSAECCGIESEKVFPHNLRKLFATTMYEQTQDIARVSEILGHSSVDTSRRYIYTDRTEVIRQMERLGLAPATEQKTDLKTDIKEAA